MHIDLTSNRCPECKLMTAFCLTVSDAVHAAIVIAAYALWDVCHSKAAANLQCNRKGGWLSIQKGTCTVS